MIPIYIMCTCLYTLSHTQHMIHACLSALLESATGALGARAAVDDGGDHREPAGVEDVSHGEPGHEPAVLAGREHAEAGVEAHDAGGGRGDVEEMSKDRRSSYDRQGIEKSVMHVRIWHMALWLRGVQDDAQVQVYSYIDDKLAWILSKTCRPGRSECWRLGEICALR